MKISPLFAAMIAGFATHASAVVINVDFNHLTSPTYVGRGAPDIVDPAGNTAYWNGAVRGGSEVSEFNLLTSTGAPSTVGYRINGISGSGNSLIDQQGGDFGNLMSDYIFPDSGSNSVVKTAVGHFLGLIPGAFYALYFYGQGDRYTSGGFRGQNSLFAITDPAGNLLAPAKQTSWTATSSGDNALTEGVEYVKFLAPADANGEIYFKWSNVVTTGPNANAATDLDGNNSKYAAFNGMQLALVPEPSSALLGGLGVLTLLRRRKRRIS